MEAYERQTHEVIRRFLGHSLSFADCIAALADLIPRLRSDQLGSLRVLMLANNETVMKEMERRGPPHEASN
jgi:hypothetical protein